MAGYNDSISDIAFLSRCEKQYVVNPRSSQLNLFSKILGSNCEFKVWALLYILGVSLTVHLTKARFYTELGRVEIDSIAWDNFTMKPENPLESIELHPASVVLISLMFMVFLRETWAIELPLKMGQTLNTIGLYCSALGVTTFVIAYVMMALHRTTINPDEPTRMVVTTGIYRLTRNPIYIGWFLAFVGRGISNQSIGQLLVALVMMVLLHFAVVLKEEQYLEYTFGDDYLKYKHKVRRWL